MAGDMASRRRRKRERRQAEPAGRGDRRPAPAPGGSGGRCGLWRDASRAELLLIRSAIHRGWPVPVERRPRILAEITEGLDGGDQRRVIAIARVFLSADRANLAAEARPGVT